MSEYKTLLKMIEGAGRNETGVFDEIDMGILTYLKMVNRDTTTEIKGKILADAPYMFCTSRDAIKSIRPKSKNGGRCWWFSLDGYNKTYTAYKNVAGGKEGEPLEFVSRFPLTEELAELHVIIQATEWERNNDKN